MCFLVSQTTVGEIILYFGTVRKLNLMFFISTGVVNWKVILKKHVSHTFNYNEGYSISVFKNSKISNFMNLSPYKHDLIHTRCVILFWKCICMDTQKSNTEITD